MNIDRDDLKNIFFLGEKLGDVTNELGDIYIGGGSIDIVNPNGYKLGKLVFNNEYDNWEFNPEGYGEDDS